MHIPPDALKEVLTQLGTTANPERTRYQILLFTLEEVLRHAPTDPRVLQNSTGAKFTAAIANVACLMLAITDDEERFFSNDQAEFAKFMATFAERLFPAEQVKLHS